VLTSAPVNICILLFIIIIKPIVSLVNADMSLVKELFIEITKKCLQEVTSPAYRVQRWCVQPATEHAAAVWTDLSKMLQHRINSFLSSSLQLISHDYRTTLET